MKVIVTITSELDDSMWGFSELLEGVSEGREQMAMDLIKEDILAVVNEATWEIRIEDDSVTTASPEVGDTLYYDIKPDNGKVVKY